MIDIITASIKHLDERRLRLVWAFIRSLMR